MDNFANAIQALLRFILDLGEVTVAAIVAIEMWLRAQLTHFSVPRTAQSVLLVVLAVCLIVGSLRLFGGLIRVVAILVVLLIAIQLAAPVVQHYWLKSDIRHSGKSQVWTIGSLFLGSCLSPTSAAEGGDLEDRSRATLSAGPFQSG